VLDHCHDTDTFRGYICKHCNDGLGGFKDDLWFNMSVQDAINMIEGISEDDEITKN